MPGVEKAPGIDVEATPAERLAGADVHLMTRQSLLKLAGGLTGLLAIFAFLTVADDLRHTGEIWGTASLFLAAICFLVAGYMPKVSKWLALYWLAVALLVAIPTGAWMDQMPRSVVLFALLGIVVAYLRRQRSQPEQP